MKLLSALVAHHSRSSRTGCDGFTSADAPNVVHGTGARVHVRGTPKPMGCLTPTNSVLPHLERAAVLSGEFQRSGTLSSGWVRATQWTPTVCRSGSITPTTRSCPRE